MYSNREQVVKYVTQNRLYKYLSKYTDNIKEIIKNLPPFITNLASFNQDECDLSSLLNLKHNCKEYKLYSKLHEFTIKFIKKNYKSHIDYILPWVSNFDEFIYYIGQIYARALIFSSTYVII